MPMKIEPIALLPCAALDGLPRSIYLSVNVHPSPHYPESRVLASIDGHEDFWFCLTRDNADRASWAMARGAKLAGAALDESLPDHAPAVFFDDEGKGPSHVCLRVVNLDRMHDNREAHEQREFDMLGLRVVPREDGDLLHDVIGGFAIDRAAAATLHREIGVWLAEHELPPVHAVPGMPADPAE